MGSQPDKRKEISLGEEFGDVTVKAHGAIVEIHTDSSVLAYTNGLVKAQPLDGTDAHRRSNENGAGSGDLAEPGSARDTALKSAAKRVFEKGRQGNFPSAAEVRDYFAALLKQLGEIGFECKPGVIQTNSELETYNDPKPFTKKNDVLRFDDRGNAPFMNMLGQTEYQTTRQGYHRPGEYDNFEGQYGKYQSITFTMSEQGTKITIWHTVGYITNGYHLLQPSRAASASAKVQEFEWHDREKAAEVIAGWVFASSSSAVVDKLMPREQRTARDPILIQPPLPEDAGTPGPAEKRGGSPLPPQPKPPIS